MKDASCMYCAENEKLQSLMLPIGDLPTGKLYLFKEQTYFGRVVLAYKDHVNHLTDLTEEEAAAFMKDILRVGKAVMKAVSPAKVNYGMFSDTLPHLHVHIVPKQEGGHTFGGTFEMNVNPPKYLTEDQYREIIAKIKENL